MNGGKFYTNLSDVFANYLLKSLQGFKNKGITPWAIGIQNEPQNSNTAYPTALIDAHWEGEIGQKLRSIMDDNGFKDTLLIGYEHNWDDAGAYPVDLMNQAADSFDGVAFHCYEGQVSQQETFHNAYPNKKHLLHRMHGCLQRGLVGRRQGLSQKRRYWHCQQLRKERCVLEPRP